MATKPKETEKDRLIKSSIDPVNAQLDNGQMLKNEGIKLSPQYYFRDGVRRIDYVIVWEQDRISVGIDQDQRRRMEEYRRRFETKLMKIGICLEREVEESEKMMINFIKVHIPFELMRKYAEALNFRAPLQIITSKSKSFSERLLKFFMIPNFMKSELPYVPNLYRTAGFKYELLEKYLGNGDEDTFFNVTQRHQVAYEILATQVYGHQLKGEIGIGRMIEENVYAAAYPMHEGPPEIPSELENSPDKWNRRQILYEHWAKWSKWYKYQPLDNIREYYGEKIALYFAWLGLYTTWLFPASLVGILVFIYGITTINTYTPGREICESNETFKMCPACDSSKACSYWFLSSVCFYAKMTYLFDHPGTVFFSVFMSIWAVSFLEDWKRKNAELAYKWDTFNYEDEDEKPRPEYAALSTERKINPVTNIEEPYFPVNLRIKRMITGVMCIILMFVVVIIFIIGVIIYRILIAIPLFENPLIRSKALIFASVSAAIVNLILIVALGLVYEKLAYKLTQWEMHRTESDFEDHLIIKVYLFEFVNFYSSIFYIAFFKGRFNGYPGHYNSFLGLRNEECSNGSCLFELAQQMGIIMIGNQIINNMQEIFLPKVITWFHRFSKGLNNMVKLSGTDVTVNLWSEDYKLLPYDGLFQEYLEMVIQFGFITIFVAAFPLAPFFALLNNWLEIRLDASKLVLGTRRPVAERAEDIGTWFTILNIIVKLSIISNAFLIAFTSDFIVQQMYKYSHNHSLDGYVNFTLAWSPNNTLSESCRYRDFRDNTGQYTKFYWHLFAIRLTFVIVFEHIVFTLAALVDILLPDIPESLQIEIKRQNYLAKQALLELDKTDFVGKQDNPMQLKTSA